MSNDVEEMLRRISSTALELRDRILGSVKNTEVVEIPRFSELRCWDPAQLTKDSALR